jgi:hypothetical protein
MNDLQSAMFIVRLFGWRAGLSKAVFFLIGRVLRRSEERKRGKAVHTRVAHPAA